MTTTEIGFIGLGRMGLHMVQRILNQGKLRVVAWNRSQEKVKLVAKQGAVGARTIPDLVKQLKQKRKVVWLMLPAGEVTENAFQQVLKLLKKDDIIIDGGNANFHDSIRRHHEAAKKGVAMLDVGVSGGLVAAERGYAMMVGGKKSVFAYCKPLFESMAYPRGYGLVSEEPGSGHYVKMVHNAIEYGMMQAIGEGYDLLKNGRMQKLDLKEVSRVWNHGCIISGLLMEMAGNAITKSQTLNYLQPHIDDSGEGKWSALEALEYNVPFTVNSYALNARYISRDKNSFAFKMVAAIRNEFGGHAIKKK